ncbi:unnamed protein product [Amoebophrya sp. A120]|nr:unnamed protein product [Amoebophrya sp. A120]|eukprot:GSA120T00025227001.1
MASAASSLPPEAVSDAGIVLIKMRNLVYSTRSIGYRAIRHAIAKTRGAEFLTVKEADECFRSASVFLDNRELCTLSRKYGDGSFVDKKLSLGTEFCGDLIPTEISSAPRRGLVQNVWKSCCAAFGSDQIDLLDFVEATNPGAFPHVKAGRVSHEECKQLLLSELEDLMLMLGKSAVDAEVFMQYGTEVSSLCALDGQFQNVMGMFSKKTALKDDTLDRQLALVDLFVRKFNEMKDHRAVFMLFHYYDPAGRMALDYPSFEAMCIGIGVNITPAEKRLIFDFFGPTGVIVSGPFLRYIFYCMEYASVELGRPADYAEIRASGPAAHDPDAEPRELCAKIRNHLIKFHPRGLSVAFNIMHTLNRVGSKIDKREFQWGLDVCGLRLGTAEADYLEYFFSSGTPQVDKEEWLDYLRGDLVAYEELKAEAKKRIDQVCPGENEYHNEDYKMKKWEPAFGGSSFVAAQFILDQYCVDHHPMVDDVGPEKLRKEFFDYLGESLAIGRAAKAKVVKYLCDEGLQHDRQKWRKYLYTCLPSYGSVRIEIDKIEIICHA